ncbi:MAG: flagellar export chaperone FliS [Bacillus sp. (in: firmicutes)]
MAVNNPYQTYQQNSVTTASPGELTIMLYNGCLKFVAQAKKAIGMNQIEARNESIQKAQNIIRELMVTLDMDYDVSKKLLSLYEYIHQRLMDANIKNEGEALTEAASLITELRDTWKQVVQLDRKQKYTGGQA